MIMNAGVLRPGRGAVGVAVWLFFIASLCIARYIIGV